MIMNKVNIRKLKLRVKNRVLKKNRMQPEQNFPFKCPVYLCKHKDQTEDGLIDHYNYLHKDLVTLGIRLIKSKETRDQIKQKRQHEKANRIYIGENDDNQNKEDTKSSFSEISDTEQEDIFGEYQDKDSDLEDLIQLQQIEIQRKKRAIENRKKIRRDRANGQSDSYTNDEYDEIDDELGSHLDEALMMEGTI